MVKAGILSMQRIYNYGSFLQAYGLNEILKELGCQSGFVDYHVRDCIIHSESDYGIKRKVSKAFEVLRYNASLTDKIKFIKYKKNYASNYLGMLGIGDEMNFLPKLDLLIIGSDEVFNCIQSNRNVGFSSELFGAPNNAKRLASYAASFGNTTLEKLKKYNVHKDVARWLSDFDSISVRDKNSALIVEELTGRAPEYNLDPVLIYDYMKKCGKIPETVNDSGYMILYGYSGRFSSEECYVIRDYAKKKGLKIYSIGGIQECGDKFLDVSPFEVIAYFKNAECVVTDTFHGSILSIITHRKFVTLIRESTLDSYGNKEKLMDLLLKLNLESQASLRLNAENLENIIENKIDYENTDRIITAERKKSYDYLKKQINSV